MTPGFATDVTVVIPTIPPRAQKLQRALESVWHQRHPPAAVSIAVDLQKVGAAATRNRALAAASTPWVAFLDDDDVLYEEHLEQLLACAQETAADLVYPWFDVMGGLDPLGKFGMVFDAEALRNDNYIPVTVLARTELVRDVGGFINVHEPPHPTCEDWGLWMRMLDAGATFVHLPEYTWAWHHHGDNTGGRSDRW